MLDAVRLPPAEVVQKCPGLDEPEVDFVPLRLIGVRDADGYLCNVDAVLDYTVATPSFSEDLDALLSTGETQSVSSSLISAILRSRNSTISVLSSLWRGSPQLGQRKTVSMATANVVLGHVGFPQW